MAFRCGYCMMNKRDKIYNIYKAEFELVKEQSAILLQCKKNGFNGELKESGYLVEIFVKDLLRRYLPVGYRICSGYIATNELLSSSDNLIQHDLIIVDDRIPSLYKFAYGDVEIVPVEAVCGIIEVKRTLTRTSLNNAIGHLSMISQDLEKDKSAKKSKLLCENNRCGPTLNVCTTAPLYGVIGLRHEGDLNTNELNTAEQSFLDIVWSVSTPFLHYLALWDENGQEFLALNTSRNQERYSYRHVSWDAEDENNADIFARAIVRLQTWIKKTSMSAMDTDQLQRYFGLE